MEILICLSFFSDFADFFKDFQLLEWVENIEDPVPRRRCSAANVAFRNLPAGGLEWLFSVVQNLLAYFEPESHRVFRGRIERFFGGFECFLSSFRACGNIVEVFSRLLLSSNSRYSPNCVGRARTAQGSFEIHQMT